MESPQARWPVRLMMSSHGSRKHSLEALQRTQTGAFMQFERPNCRHRLRLRPEEEDETWALH